MLYGKFHWTIIRYASWFLVGFHVENELKNQKIHNVNYGVIQE